MGLDAVAWVNFPSGGHASETAEPQQDSGPTGCHWVSRTGAVWAPSNPLKAKVRWMGLDAVACMGEFSIRWARIRNSRTPAGFRPNRLPLGQQSRCRLGTFEPAKSKGGWMGLDAVAWVNFPSGGHASETAEPQQDSGPTGCHWVSRAGAVWAPSNPLKAKVWMDGAGRTHPKRQNPSRMQAQRVAIGSAEPVPFGHLRTRSKQRWMDGAGRCGLGEFSIRWARMRNSRTPAGFRPNGLPLGQQSRCRLGTFEPAQSKGGWMGLDAVTWVNFPSGGHASETAEPQQNSGPTGCHWVSRAGAVWAPSNPLKAKVDGWHASETAEPPQDSGPTGCHWVDRAGAVWAPSNPLKAKVDGWGWTLWPG